MTTAINNIGPSGRRRRYLMAGALLLVGAAIAVVMVVAGIPRGYRLALALPFALASLALFQARAHT